MDLRGQDARLAARALLFAVLFLSKHKYSVGMIGKILLVLGAIASISIIVIMTFTNPSQAGPAGILGLFVSMYIVVLTATTYGLHYLSRLLSKVSVGGVAKKPTVLSMRRAYYYASVVALAPVLMVGLQSVNEVGLYELGLVGLLVSLGCVYVARRLP